MKRFASLIGVAVALASAPFVVGQQGGNPFVDHSDTGEIIHVLPPAAAIRSPHDTAPTFAPILNGTHVYSASYGSGKLIDHGGMEIEHAGFFAIYWNQSVAGSNKTSPGYATISEQLNAFVNNFSSSSDYAQRTTDDYAIIQQYSSNGTISPTLANINAAWGAFVDTKPTQNSITDSKIRSYLADLLTTGRVPLSSNTIYGLYLPPGMKVVLQGGTSCSSFCGYHGHFSYAGVQIKYASFPYLDCRACSMSGLSVADMLTIVTSHEIREAVTDPGDFNVNAWYDAAGYEADDKCAWHNLYKMTSGGFWVQPEYSNGGTIGGVTYPGLGCVVPNAN